MKHDGGPVHPMQVKERGVFITHPGKSLREEYAGLAMAAILASGERWELKVIAKRSFEMADAMLAERVK